MSRGRGGQGLANDHPLEARVEPAQTAGTLATADFVPARSELAKCLVPRNAHELVPGSGPVMDLAPFQAAAIAPLSRHRYGTPLLLRF